VLPNIHAVLLSKHSVAGQKRDGKDGNGKTVKAEKKSEKKEEEKKGEKKAVKKVRLPPCSLLAVRSNAPSVWTHARLHTAPSPAPTARGGEAGGRGGGRRGGRRRAEEGVRQGQEVRRHRGWPRARRSDEKKHTRQK